MFNELIICRGVFLICNGKYLSKMHATQKIDLGRFQDIETFTDTINPENMNDNYNNMSIIDILFSNYSI